MTKRGGLAMAKRECLAMRKGRPRDERRKKGCHLNFLDEPKRVATG